MKRILNQKVQEFEKKKYRQCEKQGQSAWFC